MSQNDVDEPVAISVDSENESGSDDDLILYENDSKRDSGSSNEPAIAQTSRSGQKTGHWSTRYTDFVTH